jgi:hypothetical protein
VTTAYAVTLRFPRSPRHDQARKSTAPCPLASECSDATGEHHTFLSLGTSAAQVQAAWQALGHHVTRVEQARWIMPSSDVPLQGQPPPAPVTTRLPRRKK